MSVLALEDARKTKYKTEADKATAGEVEGVGCVNQHSEVGIKSN